MAFQNQKNEKNFTFGPLIFLYTIFENFFRAGSGSRFSGAVKGAAIGAVAGGGLSYLRNRYSQSKTTPSPYYNDNTTRKRSFFG